MNLQDNDTLFVEQPETRQEQQSANQPEAEVSKKKEAIIAKLLASAAAGMVVGAGATYAEGHSTSNDDSENPTPENAEDLETPTPDEAEEETSEPTLEERVEALEEKEQRRERAERAHKQQMQKQEEPVDNKPEEKHEELDYFKEHEVKIIGMSSVDDNGTTVNVYYGTVDGHDAMFLDDGNGRVVACVIDVNDNGEPDDSEYMDINNYGITDQQLASYQTVLPGNNVEVLAVENNVDLDGQTVDAALVSINDQEVIFVDTNQNGEVDLAIADTNNNNSIEEDEVQDVSDSHITMPTQDDITNTLTASTDDMEDYSNNADVDVYDV